MNLLTVEFYEIEELKALHVRLGGPILGTPPNIFYAHLQWDCFGILITELLSFYQYTGGKLSAPHPKLLLFEHRIVHFTYFQKNVINLVVFFQVLKTKLMGNIHTQRV